MHIPLLYSRIASSRFLVITAMFILITVASAMSQPAVVTTKEGAEYSGRITVEGADEVTLVSADSVVTKIPRASIKSIEYVDRHAESSSTRKGAFPVFGAAFGTPAGLNLVGGYYFTPWGVRVSAMYWGRLAGVEVEFLRNIGRTGIFSHNVHVGVGTMQIGSSYFDFSNDVYFDWTYISAGYDLNLSGFHASIGFSLGSGDFANPQLMLQLGYVHEFR
jgi:hypothetical protein